MGIIDRALQAQPESSTALTLREAAAMLLASAVACDGTVAPEEAARLQSQAAAMRLFRGLEVSHLDHLLELGIEAATRIPIESVVATCSPLIPPELRVPLFALAVEL